MKISRVNKVIIIAGIIFIALSVTVGIFLRTPENNASSKEKEFITDYEITKSDSQNIVQSKEAGFFMSLPEEWIVEKSDKRVIFSNSKIKIEPGKTVVEIIEDNNICSGNLEIKKYADPGHEDIVSLKDLIHQVETGEKGQDRDYAYSLTDMGGRVFLKTEFGRDEQTVYVSMKSIADNIIYSIDSGLFFSQECEQAFDDIIKTIKIGD